MGLRHLSVIDQSLEHTNLFPLTTNFLPGLHSLGMLLFASEASKLVC